jgi:hypothetical protein
MVTALEKLHRVAELLKHRDTCMRYARITSGQNQRVWIASARSHNRRAIALLRSKAGVL